MESLLKFSDQLLAGLQVTVELALVSLLLGLLLGMLGALSQLSQFAPLRWLGKAYTQLFRGIPELLTVLMIYFGATHVLMMVGEWFGYHEYIEISAFAAGVTALGVTFGAFAAEVFRGAIQAIPAGQWEASWALGFNRRQTFFKIILPQVWRVALPGLGNLFLVLLKDTALVSVVGLEELMRVSAQAVNFSREPFTFYLAAAVLYLLLTAVTMLLMRWLEARSQRGYTRNSVSRAGV